MNNQKNDRLGSQSRRVFVAGSTVALSGTLAACAAGPATTPASDTTMIIASQHWAYKETPQGRVRLFAWRKVARGGGQKGALLFVHGSSMASTPVFDLQVPSRERSSVMDYYAQMGFDTWCFDCEGYGRSDKQRDINFNIANGADDLAVIVPLVTSISRQEKVLLYGASSGGLRAALYAQRDPSRVRRLALDAFVWTGKGSPTLTERRKRLPQYQANNRRPIDRAFVRSIFTRDHPETSDLSVVEAFADAVLALDSSVPTGTYVDMTAHLPVVDPTKITVPVLIMRGQWDGIASLEDVNDFYLRLPNPDKQLTVMPGIAHTSFRSKNFALAYHLLTSFITQPAPVYVG